MIRRFVRLFFVCGIITMISSGYYSNSYAASPSQPGITDPGSALSVAMSHQLHAEHKAKKQAKQAQN